MRGFFRNMDGQPNRLWRRVTTTPGGVSLILCVVALALVAAFLRDDSSRAQALSVAVTRGDLSVRLAEPGVLRPVQSLTYRSPVEGREVELDFLAPEGTLVQKGDLVARLATADLQRELDRAVQANREAQIQLRVGQVNLQEAEAAVDGTATEQGALSVQEAQSAARLAAGKLVRLRTEHESLRPLLEQGYVTREEYARSAWELEQATAEADLTARKAALVADRTQPREANRARLTLSQRQAELDFARLRVDETQRAVRAIAQVIERCSIYATHEGLVLHEEHVSAVPRRRVRVGDRVTSSQGLVTIPDVSRMTVETSVREVDVHRVNAGDLVEVFPQAFPDMRLRGTIARIGALAQTAPDRGERRFSVVVALPPDIPNLKPEMTARVEIIVAERSGVLIAPRGAIFDRQSGRVARVITAFGSEIRPVMVGEQNDIDIEITGGLREGDRLLLSDRVGDDAQDRARGRP